MTIQTSKATVLFDIDKTLLNTDLFVKRLSEMVAKLSNRRAHDIDKEIDLYVESLPLIFYIDFLTFLDRLSLSDSEFRAIKEQYLNNDYIYPKYDDVIPTLEVLKDNYSIGVFSEGVPRFQSTKLKNLQIDAYIDKKLVFIGQSKRTIDVLSELPAGCYVVDDNIDVIQVLARHGSVNPIYLQRDALMHIDLQTTDFETIHTLSELPEKLKIK